MLCVVLFIEGCVSLWICCLRCFVCYILSAWVFLSVLMFVWVFLYRVGVNVSVAVCKCREF